MNRNKLDVDDFFDQTTDEKNVVDFLSSLPEEGSREWETSLTDLVTKEDSVDVDRVIDILENLIESKQHDAEIRFAAFFAYCTRLRRDENYQELGGFIEDYATEYENRLMYLHLKGMYIKGKGGNMEEALNYSKKAAEMLEEEEELDNAGVYHSVASGLVGMMEDTSKVTQDKLEEAEEYIGLALENSDYAKFYATKGRLRSLQGYYGEAKDLIERAISKEDPERRQYAARLGNYHRHLFKNLSREKDENINKTTNVLEERLDKAENDLENAVDEAVDRAEEEVKKSRTSTLQVLGFFSAIIAVVVTTVQISTGFTPSAAAFLFLVITGGLTSSFSLFAVLLSGDDIELRRIVFTIVAGFVLIVIGLTGVLYI